MLKNSLKKGPKKGHQMGQKWAGKWAEKGAKKEPKNDPKKGQKWATKQARQLSGQSRCGKKRSAVRVRAGGAGQGWWGQPVMGLVGSLNCAKF